MPVLVVMSGPPGTGKRTITEARARARPAVVVSVDPIEAVLNRTGITRDHGDGSHRTAYEVTYMLARQTLRTGLSVVADAIFVDPADRHADLVLDAADPLEANVATAIDLLRGAT